jgi:hypothetical protein
MSIQDEPVGECQQMRFDANSRAASGVNGRVWRFATTARLTLGAVLLGMTFPSSALANPCEVPDAGGTVVLPPAGCDYLSPDEVHVIIDGLPPGTTIELKPIHKDFICYESQALCTQAIPPGLCEAPGGSQGGNLDCFDSTLQLEVKGTGLLAGFNRTLNVGAFTEVHTGPRNPGDPVQDFDTEMVQLQADLFGDPDFDFLQIRAGSAFGLPSPGHTTLTQLGNGNWQVDSFFDVTYQIDFQGAPGSILDGLAGSTSASLTMGSNVNPCDVVDNGTGTVDLPPAGCEYHNALPDDVHRMIDGLPPGTTIRLNMIHRNFFCGNPSPLCSIALPGGVCEGPGGSLGGNVDCFQSEARLTIEGTGTLAGFNRTITVPLDTEVHTGPRNPGDSVQVFPNRMYRLQGEIFGDPDFCTLRIRAGDQLGLPSPGETVLTDKGNGTFAVDSFFDVSYEIDFLGCPGSMLEGFGGTASGTVRMQTGDPQTADETPVPGITGGWLLLFGGLLALSSAWAIRRFATTA